MQETQVQSLIGEDPTCLRATTPMHHNHQARTLGARALQLATRPQLQNSTCSPQLEKAHTATETQHNQ